MTQDNAKPDTNPDSATQDSPESEAARTGADAPLGEDERPDSLEAERQGADKADAAPDGPDPEAELAEARDKLLRAYAEMENTKKRAQRDVKDAREYAVTGFARDMLDVADNLARALASIDDDAKQSAGPAFATLIEGVELTERRLGATLERHGVKRVEPSPGDPFNANHHQAAAQVPADQPKGAVAHVMQPGYVIGERTLRAAMVVVSAGPADGGGQAKPQDKPDSPQGGTGGGTGGGVDVSA
jgi:molecular chaperone GrpE